MEHIDIIIIAGVSFLLVTGGLFIGMFFARRTEAERAEKLEEREERVLRMRAKLEHDRFSVSAEESDDAILDEDLFKGFKEELEQERLELDMRREELELDMRMLEEENDRLKSRLTGPGSVDASIVSDADEATIVDEDFAEQAGDIKHDIEDAVFADAVGDEPSDSGDSDSGGSDSGKEVEIEAAALKPDSDEDDAHEVAGEDVAEPDVPEAEVAAPDILETEDVTDTAEDEKARNTIFGDFFFDDAATPDFTDLNLDKSAFDDVEASTQPEDSIQPEGSIQPEESTADEAATSGESPKEPDTQDDGWSSEPDEPEPTTVDVNLREPVGGDGAALTTHPESGSTSLNSEEQSTPSPPAFDHMLTRDAGFHVDGPIEQVLGLSHSDLALMNDLGYGTFRAIADLTDDEITRLAEAFDIPETTIRDKWVPDSRARAAREPRA